MSLVAAYGDSDSENSNSSDSNENKPTQDATSIRSSPEGSSEEDEEDKATHLTSSPAQEKQALPPADKLPIPGFLTKDNRSQPHNGRCLPTTSVFSNPFVEAERAKKSALEKHVKMVDGGAAITINGKKVCWNYRKGRCRFGHNCKYAHDSDLQKSTAQLAAESQRQATVVCQSDNAGPPMKRASRHGQTIETNESISDDEMNNGNQNSKRKRPGLSQGLQPGKKVLKQYQKLKNHH